MKKTYKIYVDCANCASKMELTAQRTPGVANAVVNFMTQKMTLEADEADFARILEEACQCIRKVEPDCTVIR